PGSRTSNLRNAVWPSPVLAAGTILVGAFIVAGLSYSHSHDRDWSLGFAVLRSLYFTLWIVSNLQFLQYMNLRPGKHPLVMSVLYLSIYYICACFFLSAFNGFRIVKYMPVTCLFVPSGVFLLVPTTWRQSPPLWATGLALQLIVIVLFFFLQSRRL